MYLFLIFFFFFFFHEDSFEAQYAKALLMKFHLPFDKDVSRDVGSTYSIYP